MIELLKANKKKAIDAFRQFVGVRNQIRQLTVTAHDALSRVVDLKVSQMAINDEIGERLRRLEKCIVMIAKEVDKDLPLPQKGAGSSKKKLV